MTQAWAVELPAGDKLVLLALADCANDEGKCWPGLASLCAKTGMCKRTLQEALRQLDNARHITRVENPGKGMNYTVHPVAKSAPVEENATGGKICTGGKTCREPVAKSAPKPSRTVITSEAKASSVKRVWPLPPGVSFQVWTDFLKSPKRRKAGMSETAYVGIVKNLRICAEHGFPPGETLALAVERGWTTVKLEWVQNAERDWKQNERSDGPSLDQLIAARFGQGDGVGEDRHPSSSGVHETGGTTGLDHPSRGFAGGY